MKVSQILTLCKDLANLDLPQNCYQDQGDDYTTSSCARVLYHSLNNVVEEIYCNFATDVNTAVVTATKNHIDTQSLNLCRVLKLTDGFGNKRHFRYTERGLFVEKDGIYNVTYAKMPPKVEWQGQFELPLPAITPSIVSAGVLADYFFAIGDVVLAEKWRQKYVEGITRCIPKRPLLNLPARGWW